MNLLQEIESVFAPLNAAVKSDWLALEAAAKNDVAMLYGAVKNAGTALDAAAVALLPGAVAQIKAEALAVVTSLENNTAFKNAVGSWKFGTASALLLQSIESGALSLVPIAKTAGVAFAPIIETAIQAAFVVLKVSL